MSTPAPCALEDIRLIAAAYISAPVDKLGERQSPEETTEEPDKPTWYECQGHCCGELFDDWAEVEKHLAEEQKQPCLYKVWTRKFYESVQLVAADKDILGTIEADDETDLRRQITAMGLNPDDYRWEHVERVPKWLTRSL